MISKDHRFHGLGSLRPLYQRGKTVRTAEISLKFQENPRLKTWRAAVVVSKKIHKSAVKRNRVRRRIYEIIRLAGPKVEGPYEFIFSVFSDQVIDWPREKLAREVTKLLRKAGVINR